MVITKALKQKVYDRGEVIINKGEKGKEVIIILRGLVGIYLDDQVEDCCATMTDC